MRLRNVPGAAEAVAAHARCIQQEEAKEHKGRWQECFEKPQPLRVEIGMGKGRFVMEMARLHPEINYIGIERYDSVMVRALQKYDEDPLPNVIFISMNAEYICDVFAPGEVDRIYLNFSDPWPKDRHAKRRLTSAQYLARYDQILADDGHIEFKTDNQDLFSWSLEQVEPAGWKIIASTTDLHHDPVMNEGNVMTEYEERFSELGNPICKMVIALQKTFRHKSFEERLAEYEGEITVCEFDWMEKI